MCVLGAGVDRIAPARSIRSTPGDPLPTDPVGNLYTLLWVEKDLYGRTPSGIIADT